MFRCRSTSPSGSTPRVARTEPRSRRDQGARRGPGRPHHDDRRAALAGGEPIEVVQPHSTHHVLGHTWNATDRDVPPRSTRRWRPRPAWRALPADERAAVFLRRPPTCSPGRGATGSTPRRCSASPRPASRPRSTQPASWPTSGGSTSTSRAASSPSSPSPRRHLEPHRPPAARGLRPRHHAVQLHLDRGEPADRAGADGCPGGLEAVAHPGLLGPPHRCGCWRRRPAAGCHQPRHR